MPETLANGAASTLNGAITNSATSLVIQSADVSKFPSSGTFRLSVTDGTNTELMTVTGGQGTATLTVLRANEPYAGVQTAFAFASGSTVAEVLTTAALTNWGAGTGTAGDKLLLDYIANTVIGNPQTLTA